MTVQNEEKERTRLVQKLTCVCCTLCHKNEAELVVHLRGMSDRVTAQLARLSPPAQTTTSVLKTAT